METTTHDKLKKIKQSFRLYMNGEASHSMRQKGVNYKINWGIELPRLRQMAAEYGADAPLAEALWQSEVRECKLLATLIMPPDAISLATAEAWVATCGTQEVAEMLAFNLLQKTSFAPQLTLSLLQSSDSLSLHCAFNLAGRLAPKGVFAGSASINTLAQKAAETLLGTDAALRHAALNALVRCADASEEAEKTIAEVLKNHNLDIF